MKSNPAENKKQQNEKRICLSEHLIILIFEKLANFN